jgi:hypothetical protein
LGESETFDGAIYRIAGRGTLLIVNFEIDRTVSAAQGPQSVKSASIGVWIMTGKVIQGSFLGGGRSSCPSRGFRLHLLSRQNRQCAYQVRRSLLSRAERSRSHHPFSRETWRVLPVHPHLHLLIDRQRCSGIAAHLRSRGISSGS